MVVYQTDEPKPVSSDLDRVRTLCRIRDSRFTTDFYKKPFFEVVKPLIETIRYDGGISCFIGDKEKLLPEAAATCLLALYRLNLVDDEVIYRIQAYLVNSNSEVARISAEMGGDLSKIDPRHCAWSANQGRNVWSTSQILWALIVTRYRGAYLPVLTYSIEWLLEQQYPTGGWSLVAGKENQENVFVTSVTIYTLQLSLKSLEWDDNKKRRIAEAIKSGCKYIVKERTKKGYWIYDQNKSAKSEVEYTTTAMAIWALYHCAFELPDVAEIVNDGIKALRKGLSNKSVWDNKIALEGLIPETNIQQVFQGFTPSIALILLRIGIPADDELILKPIELLLNTRTELGWGFYSTAHVTKSAAGFLDPKTHYVGLGVPMTFTTALALWTVEEWHRQLLKQNLHVQRDAGYLDVRLSASSSKTPVAKFHLATILLILDAALITLYFVVLSLLFDESLIDILNTLTIKDVSDLLDSILKLFVIPLIIITLSVNFYSTGRLSFHIIRDLWDKLFS